MSLDEKVKAFIEVLKIVAWPAIVGLIFWYLRDEVKRAGTRITELSLTGAKFALPEQIPSRPAEGISAASGHSITAERGAYSVTGSETEAARASQPALFIAEIKARISEDQLEPSVQRIRGDLANIIGPDPKNQLEALTYFSASLNGALGHERNYAGIYGSQLQLLAQMNIDLGVPPSVARQIYDTAKSANPEVYQAYPFEEWIAFLQNSGLITVAGNGNYVLTPYGRGFLKYILDRHLSVNKPF